MGGRSELGLDIRGNPIPILGHVDSEVLRQAATTDKTWSGLSKNQAHELAISGAAAASTATIYLPDNGTVGYTIQVGNGREWQFKTLDDQTTIRVTVSSSATLCIRPLR